MLEILSETLLTVPSKAEVHPSTDFSGLRRGIPLLRLAV